MNIFKNISVSEICSAYTVSSEKGRSDKIINRPFYGLSFCTAGEIIYTHNGIDYISDSSHAIILPKNETYLLKQTKSGSFPLINFNCTNDFCKKHTVIPIKDLQPYLSDYEKLKALCIFENKRLKLLSIFYNILQRLSSESEQIPEILLPAVSYITKNFSDVRLNNSLIAQQANISEVYFRKLFIKHYKTTPKQFIIDMRINKAKQLLTDGILKISAVAENCGFSNPYHFSRLFKQLTGLTPTEYSKQNRIYKI